MFKIISKFSLFFLTLILIIKSWVILTSGFHIEKIKTNKNFFKFSSIMDDFISREKYDVNDQFFIDNLNDILDQKYKFLSKGRQSFVFKSLDDRYVIKLLRYHRFKESLFERILSFFPYLDKINEKKTLEKKISFLENMQSYNLAYKEIPKESATLYVHLNKTCFLNNKIQIIDKFNRSFFLDINDFAFILQKNALSFEKELLKQKNDKKKSQDILLSFFENLTSIYSKKIINDDRHIVQNLGIVDGKVVEIDIGRFVKRQDLNKNEVLKKEANHYTTYLRKWVEKNIPKYLPFFDENLKLLIENKNI